MSYDDRRAGAPTPSTDSLKPDFSLGDPLLDQPDPVVTHATGTASQPKSNGRAVREIVETLLLAVIIFFAVRAVVLNFKVDGLSMFPNLDNGEMLLVNRNAYAHFDLNAIVNWIPGVERDGEHVVYPFDPPQRGDIIVFNPPLKPQSPKPYVKRVIGLAGETVEVKEGIIYVDGQPLDEPYIDAEITFCGAAGDCPAVTVPADHVFVLGDNRRNSSDSRSFGPVPVGNIIGKAWLTYWPKDDMGLVPHYDYPNLPNS